MVSDKLPASKVAQPEETESLSSARSDAFGPSGSDSKRTTEAQVAFQQSVTSDLSPYHENVEKLFDKFAKRTDLPTDSKTHIIDSLSKILKGEGLQPTGITAPEDRKMLVAGIVDNLGDPHGIDQGSFPTCTTAAAEEQHYTAQGGDNPGATVYIVDALADIALTGRLKAHHPFIQSDKITELTQAELRPDWEAKRDQGTNDYRNFASQLYHTAARKGVQHSELKEQFAAISPDLSVPERVRLLQEHLERRSSITIGVNPISRFNQVMAGSEPFYKAMGHAVNIYRQKDEHGQAAFANGEPLYFLSDQRGRELEKANLTKADLQKIYEEYPNQEEPKFNSQKPEALPGEQQRRDFYFNRLKDIQQRAVIMKRLGEGQHDR